MYISVTSTSSQDKVTWTRFTLPPEITKAWTKYMRAAVFTILIIRKWKSHQSLRNERQMRWTPQFLQSSVLRQFSKKDFHRGTQVEHGRLPELWRQYWELELERVRERPRQLKFLGQSMREEMVTERERKR